MNGLSTKNELRIVVPAKQKRRHLSKLVGYGGEPAASHFPLQLCEGDCDNGQVSSSSYPVSQQATLPELGYSCFGYYSAD